VRLADEVNSSHDKVGDLFAGTVDPSVLVNDHVVIPRGTEALIRMVQDNEGGHLHGKSNLIMNGERRGVATNAPNKQKGSASAKASSEAQKGSQGAGVVSGKPGAVAGPIIAAFSAAKAREAAFCLPTNLWRTKSEYDSLLPCLLDHAV
jgi:hypothetical protein